MYITFAVELGPEKDNPELVKCYEKIIEDIFEGCDNGISMDTETGSPKDPNTELDISDNRLNLELFIPEATEDTVSRFKQAINVILACNPTRDKGQYIGYIP